MLPIISLTAAADGEKTPEAPAAPDDASQPAGDTTANTASGAPEEQNSQDRKVDLDLDDAPFLKKDAPLDDVPEASEPPAEGLPAEIQNADAPEDGEHTEEEDPKKLGFFKRKKKLVLAAAALLILLLGGGFFFLRGGAPENATPQEETAHTAEAPASGHGGDKQTRQVVISSKNPAQEAGAPALPSVVLAPFWVELKDTEGDMRLLVCKFVLTMKEARTQGEIAQKMLPIRDALFYYLRNKSYAFYADPDNINVLKDDTKSIINDYLVSNKLAEVLLDSYLIK